jgi:hypothetical protein
MGVGGYTYSVHLSMFFQDLTPNSIFEEIWYGSRGLHLIRAPIYVSKNVVKTRSEPFSTRPGPNSTEQLIPSLMKHSTTSPK